MRKFAITGFSGCLVVVLVLAGIVMLALMFLQGGVWLGEKAMPILEWAARITCGVVVVALLPMAAFRQTQRHAAVGLMYAASIFGATLWVWSLLLTYNLWGGGAVLLGVCLFGVGVVPMAMVATLFEKLWPTFTQLLLLALLTYRTRHFGKQLALKLQREEAKVYEAEIV